MSIEIITTGFVNLYCGELLSRIEEFAKLRVYIKILHYPLLVNALGIFCMTITSSWYRGYDLQIGMNICFLINVVCNIIITLIMAVKLFSFYKKIPIELKNPYLKWVILLLGEAFSLALIAFFNIISILQLCSTPMCIYSVLFYIFMSSWILLLIQSYMLWVNNKKELVRKIKEHQHERTLNNHVAIAVALSIVIPQSDEQTSSTTSTPIQSEVNSAFGSSSNYSQKSEDIVTKK